MIDLITSVNPALFEQYGRQMVAEFERCAGADLRLTVVFEGPMPAEAARADGRCRFVPFTSRDHQRFLQRFGNLYEANGIRFQPVGRPEEQLFRAERIYLFDAVRFSFKLFAIEIGRKSVGKRSAFAWIDADVRCLKPFMAADVDPFLPRKNELMSYLGRDRFPYSECGFLGFNGAHPRLGDYFERMRALYLTGELFALDQWHDSFLWDHVRREFEGEGVRFRNISGAASTTEHPFINCGLGEFFDHLKGPERKQRGRSLDADYQMREAPPT